MTTTTYSTAATAKRGLARFLAKHADFAGTLDVIPADAERFTVSAFPKNEESLAAAREAGFFVNAAAIEPEGDPSEPVAEPPAETAPCPVEVDAGADIEDSVRAETEGVGELGIEVNVAGGGDPRTRGGNHRRRVGERRAARNPG